MADQTTVALFEDATGVSVVEEQSTVVSNGYTTGVVFDADNETVILVIEDHTRIVSGDDASTVVVFEKSTIVIGSSEAGPAGPPGPPGGSAAEDLILTYDVDDVLQTVDGETFFLTMGYDMEGKLITVTDSVSGQVKTLGYDSNDLLVSVVVS